MTEWQEPLVRRPRLPARAQRMLAEIVTGHLLETLAARKDLDPKVELALRSALARVGPNSMPPPFARSARIWKHQRASRIGPAIGSVEGGGPAAGWRDR